MKKRYGFVSNSSSSSFIIGYGTVKDKNALNEYMKKHGIKFDYDLELFNYETSNHLCESIDGEPTITLWGGNDTDLSVPKNMINEDLLTVCIHNDEGDGAFCTYDHNGDFIDLDYDDAFEESFYSEEQQAIMNIFNQSFIENGFVQIGAERNG